MSSAASYLTCSLIPSVPSMCNWRSIAIHNTASFPNRLDSLNVFSRLTAKDMPVTPYAGPSGYTPFYISIYDTYVLRFSMPVYWGCSTNNDLRPLFSGNFSKRHVDIGVGIGYFLAEAMRDAHREPKISMSL
ncbi:hypothetical protein HZ326_14367 [Fusarium oxysporum f. sp. albedinis]|nr:hypothetical protein HZ326_14367 [Fusarium oxysporum f. sp. albedinis]